MLTSITSSLPIGYFFNPSPYFQVRSFSISTALFIGFSNKHFDNFPDILVASGPVMCGTLLSTGRSTEFSFPFPRKLVCSGVTAPVLWLTSLMLIYFSSPS
jgi:hypothetical protein